MDPLVHRRLPLLGPLDIQDLHERLDGDTLKKLKRRVISHGRRRGRDIRAYPDYRRRRRRRRRSDADKMPDAKVYDARVCARHGDIRFPIDRAIKTTRAELSFFAINVLIALAAH